MRIFLTGGTGFLGSHLVRKLQTDKHRLCLLTTRAMSDSALATLPRDAALIQGNLGAIDRWKKELEEFQPEAVIHLAWENIPRYDAETSIGNLRYGLNLFQTVASLGCPLTIAAGSGWEYGLDAGKKSEDMPPRPFSAFGAAKTALQWLGMEIAKERGQKFIWTRIFYVYGPGQRPESLTPYIIRCAHAGKPPELKNPLAQNDFVFVDDVIGAIALLLKHGPGSGIYNIGSGRATSVQDVVTAVFRAFNQPLTYGAAKSRVPTDAVSGVWADIAKIKTDVGWQPTTTLEQGIKKTIAYYSANPRG